MNVQKGSLKNTPGLLVGQACHQGLVRNENQDRILILEDDGIFLLADGMGGHSGGGIASQIAITSIVRELQSSPDLKNAISTANDDIKSAAQSGDGSAGMGTTIVALMLTGGNYRLAWVGDSRVYKINGGIDQLTTDHSLVQELVAQGIISAEKASSHPRRHILTRALGIMGDPSGLAGTGEGKLEDGETLLLCSDGLHGLISDKEIFSIVKQSSGPQSAANGLLDAAGS